MLIKLDVVVVIVSVALLAPVAVAVIVDEPAAIAVDRERAGGAALRDRRRSAGETVTKFVLPLTRFTASPPVGAGCASVIVPVRLRPTPTSALGALSVIPRRLTFTVAVPSWNPAAVAVMIAEPVAAPVVIVAVPADAPSGMRIAS